MARDLQLLLEGLLTHYLPIFIALRLFRINREDVNLTSSLVRNSEDGEGSGAV